MSDLNTPIKFDYPITIKNVTNDAIKLPNGMVLRAGGLVRSNGMQCRSGEIAGLLIRKQKDDVVVWGETIAKKLDDAVAEAKAKVLAEVTASPTRVASETYDPIRHEQKVLRTIPAIPSPTTVIASGPENETPESVVKVPTDADTEEVVEQEQVQSTNTGDTDEEADVETEKLDAGKKAVEDEALTPTFNAGALPSHVIGGMPVDKSTAPVVAAMDFAVYEPLNKDDAAKFIKNLTTVDAVTKVDRFERENKNRVSVLRAIADHLDHHNK
jgi:hypothetical protein